MNKHSIEQFKDKVRQIHGTLDHPNQLIGLKPDRRIEALLVASLQYIDAYPYPLTEISTVVYHLLPGGFIVANYNDSLLWLDNHWNEDDFEEFIAQEQVLVKLNNDPNRLAQFLTRTKFAFLYDPVFIRAVEDIPVISTKEKNLVKEGMDKTLVSKMELFYKDKELQLSKLTQHIRPPQFSTHANGSKMLQFYVWTRVNGFVFMIDCFFGATGSFSYSGKQLAISIGRCFPDR